MDYCLIVFIDDSKARILSVFLSLSEMNPLDL